jgi:2-polyprenyl-3-methyl-5-hydroxy-6-metoxy-1,4-benzoquinol methylase
LREVGRVLAATPAERVLDVGCGSGGFCLAVPGEYVGIDLDPGYIAFARWRWGAARRSFRVGALEALPDSERFDKAMLVNTLHHLSDPEADAVFGRLARIVRGRLVVADADSEAANWFQAFLLAHDRGNFVRPASAQRALLGCHFAVVEERRFKTMPPLVVQTLFVCEPRS